MPGPRCPAQGPYLDSNVSDCLDVKDRASSSVTVKEEGAGGVDRIIPYYQLEARHSPFIIITLTPPESKYFRVATSFDRYMARGHEQATCDVPLASSRERSR